MNIFIKILNFLLTYSSGTFIIFCLLLFFIIFVLNFLVADPKSVSFIWQYFASFVYSCNQTFFLSVHDFSFFIFMPASMKKKQSSNMRAGAMQLQWPMKISQSFLQSRHTFNGGEQKLWECFTLKKKKNVNILVSKAKDQQKIWIRFWWILFIKECCYSWQQNYSST